MATTVHECPHCGAKISSRGADACAYCGAPLPRDPAAPASTGAAREADVSIRFRALQGHADFARLMAYEPSTVREVATSGGRLLFAAVFAVVAISVASSFSGVNQGIFRVAPILIVVAAVLVVGRTLLDTRDTLVAKLRRRAALVVDERTVVTSGSDDTRARTTHHVTIELEDGRREELRARGRVAGLVTEGDIGVAYSKGRSLVDFQRVAV